MGSPVLSGTPPVSARFGGFSSRKEERENKSDTHTRSNNNPYARSPCAVNKLPSYRGVVPGSARTFAHAYLGPIPVVTPPTKPKQTAREPPTESKRTGEIAPTSTSTRRALEPEFWVKDDDVVHSDARSSLQCSANIFPPADNVAPCKAEHLSRFVPDDHDAVQLTVEPRVSEFATQVLEVEEFFPSAEGEVDDDVAPSARSSLLCSANIFPPADNVAPCKAEHESRFVLDVAGSDATNGNDNSCSERVGEDIESGRVPAQSSVSLLIHEPTSRFMKGLRLAEIDCDDPEVRLTIPIEVVSERVDEIVGSIEVIRPRDLVPTPATIIIRRALRYAERGIQAFHSWNTGASTHQQYVESMWSLAGLALHPGSPIVQRLCWRLRGYVLGAIRLPHTARSSVELATGHGIGRLDV